jgi:hypothetical protein
MIYLTCVYEDEPTHLVMRKIFEQFPGRFAESISIPCYGFGKIKNSPSLEKALQALGRIEKSVVRSYR